MFIGFLITCYDFFTLRSDISAGFSGSYSFGRSLAFNVAAAFMGGLMGGSFLVFYVNEKFRDKPYGFTIMAVLISFVTIIAIITVILGWIVVTLQTGKSLSDPETKKLYYNFLFNPLHAKNIVVWASVVAVTQIMLQFNTKFGEGNLFNMIRGKYQTPREEQRIFMFLDLNSSTTIAEKLGMKNTMNC